MTTLCARCSWQPDIDAPEPPRDQLRAHALDWAHPLCTVCARSLDDTHSQTCEQCINRTQETLSGIITMWLELPRELGHAKAAPLDRDGRGGSEEFVLPGGTTLALLAPGGVGNVLPKSGNTEHLEDNQTDDAPSVAWLLASWEDDFRHSRGEPAAVGPGSTNAVVRAAAGYLERHTRWAANSHPAFDEYSSDLRGLHARLEVALGRVRRPVKAGADCFDCGGTLERPLHEVTTEVVRPWWIPNGIGPRTAEDAAPIPRTGPLEFESEVVCRRCGSRYDAARYLLALAAKAEEGRENLDGWVSIPAAAAASARPVKTVRSWLGEQIPWALRIEARKPTPDNPAQWRVVEHLAWYPALAERAERAQRRRRIST